MLLTNVPSIVHLGIESSFSDESATFSQVLNGKR